MCIRDRFGVVFKVDSDQVRIGRTASATTDGINIAIGNQANAADSDTIAIGHDADAINTYSIAIGRLASANGGFTGRQIAIGSQANTDDGQFNIAIGSNADASLAFNTIAIGPDSRASALSAIAIGDGTTASDTTSIALGVDATASEQSAIAIGHLAVADEDGSVAIGRDASTHLDDVIALGRNTQFGVNAVVDREGSMIKLPMRSTLPDVSSLSQITSDGEYRYEGMMCVNVPPGSTPNSSDAHIAIYWQGAWRRIEFGGTISPD